jgi:hypothetical protein
VSIEPGKTSVRRPTAPPPRPRPARAPDPQPGTEQQDRPAGEATDPAED